MDEETEPQAPRDPRLSWDLPPLGGLPVVADVDELTSRVLAPNPSMMSLDGTNTYVLAPDGAGEAVLVDPGPQDEQHLRRVEAVLEERDARPTWIVVTHRHADHAAAAASWARHFDVRIAACRPDVAGPDGWLVRDGDRIELGGLHLEVVATPGHTSDHLSLRSPTGALLTGDHVLGRGTTVVSYPDGDLNAYLASLRRVLDLDPDLLLPGHGPELGEDPAAVLRYYREHRAFREAQLLAVLGDGARTPADLVAVVYADVDRRLWSAAEASTRATLAALEERGRVRFDAQDRAMIA